MTQWGLDTLFNPAKRHMDEEKRRLQSTREQIGDSSGGKRIDLESGKVTIHRSTPADETGAEEQRAEDQHVEEQQAETASTNPSETKIKSKAQAKAATERQLSPAQIRAAKRRGREPR
jgi:hypothetical protein